MVEIPLYDGTSQAILMLWLRGVALVSSFSRKVKIIHKSSNSKDQNSNKPQISNSIIVFGFEIWGIQTGRWQKPGDPSRLRRFGMTLYSFLIKKGAARSKSVRNAVCGAESAAPFLFKINLSVIPSPDSYRGGIYQLCCKSKLILPLLPSLKLRRAMQDDNLY